jgi:hypothetical protein
LAEPALGVRGAGIFAAFFPEDCARAASSQGVLESLSEDAC